MSDHYKTLELRRGALAEEIQHAYRNLALRYHPDRNGASDSATKMSAINEAWAVLGDPIRRREYDASLAQPMLHPGFAAAITLAARDIVLRGGWRVLEDAGRTLLLENVKQKIRVVFVDRIDNPSLLALTRQSPEFCVVLSLRVEGPIGPSGTVIDLLHSESFGSPVPEPARALFTTFL